MLIFLSTWITLSKYFYFILFFLLYIDIYISIFFNKKFLPLYKKIWLYVAQSIYEKGVLCYERRDMENSIVSFMKFTKYNLLNENLFWFKFHLSKISIMNNLPKHLEYSYYIGSEQYINMIKVFFFFFLQNLDKKKKKKW